MKKLSKIISLVLVAVLITAVFAGCGNTKDDVEETKDGSTTQAVVSEALADGKLVVGTNAEFPPFEFLGDDGKPDGFDMALMKEIGKILDVEITIENMEFKSLLGAMGNRIDVIAAAMTVKEERLLAVDFSDSYYTATQYVIAQKDSELAIESIDDLAGMKIGVQEGTTGDFIATDDIENSKVSRFKKGVDAVIDLRNGKIDVVIIDSNPSMEYVSLYNDIEIIAKDIFEPEYYAIALPKGDTVLADAINNALKTLKDNGKYDELIEMYINK
ncbi:MAG TPA: basic amino acid ABC transporter substrate-binding protein [Clostridia bacterium]|nr:basic amino acid ABC transporter substrate-binding protein [Clostridia bacterium]